VSALSRWLRQWTGIRIFREDAALVAREAFAEPAAADVRWLAALAPDHDQDHALWELRYARRAMFFHAARRDALTDDIAAAVAHALEDAMQADPAVDSAKREMALSQFNSRLRAYGQSLDEHDGRAISERAGELLLSLAGVRSPRKEDVMRAAGCLSAVLRGANESLRAHFGTPSLPEDVQPSRAAAGARK
jgi:hypothetical protein